MGTELESHVPESNCKSTILERHHQCTSIELGVRNSSGNKRFVRTSRYRILTEYGVISDCDVGGGGTH